MSEWLWLIPAFPLLGATLAAGLGSVLKGRAHWPVVIGSVAACVVAFLVFGEVYRTDGHALHGSAYTWFAAGDVVVKTGLQADALTAIMLVTITFVGSLIAVFAVGYMHGDPGYPRFFALIGLFLFSMTVLVLGDNLIMLYAGWEGVGLCSYALVGYYYARPAAAAAARKAFLVTRLGDAAMIVGVFMLWASLGFHLDYAGMFERETLEHANPAMLTAACLLLFCGCVGKSAQFPLHVWLADAMEGPTPVSALIHAATMVTAGVYLVARTTPVFVFAPVALVTVAVIGAFTALLAALIALTQHDLKRVLAYSTVSQLGYMFLALGCGFQGMAELAVTAAVFHLFTHAFFKALLFLSAGSVMHAMGDVIDMREFSGLRKKLPITHFCFLMGALALAAVPPLSGFWSKDLILEAAYEVSAGRHAGGVGRLYLVLFGVGLFTALLTAFYTFRAYFRTFWGEVKVPEAAHGHDHESPAVMWVPLTVLAAGAVFLGVLLGPTDRFEDFLKHTLGLETAGDAHGITGVKHAHMADPLAMGLASLVVAAVGIALAWVMYGGTRRPSEPTKGPLAGLYALSSRRFFLDELYDAVVVKPLAGLATLSAGVIDRLIDGLAMVTARVPAWLAVAMRPIQNGLVQFYALAMLMGLVAFLLFLTSRGFK